MSTLGLDTDQAETSKNKILVIIIITIISEFFNPINF
jgi:hypothetical protein